MGLLDGDLKEVFGSVFAPLLLDATITKVTLTPDGEGGMSESTETASAKGMVEKYSALERQRDGIPMTDVKLIVLQKDVALIPDLDSKITIRGQLYSIHAKDEDPAQAAWTLQGRPIITGDTAGPVSITADAAGSAEAGTPRLRLVVDNTVGAVASVGGPGRFARVGAEVSGIAAVGQPRRTVAISGEVSGSADAGTPDIAGEFSGDANGVAEVGVPRTEIHVAAEAAGAGAVGAPDSNVMVNAEAGAVADAAAGIGVAIEINRPASGIADAGAAEVAGEFNATATGVGGVGAPQREVRTSAGAESVGNAGTVTRSIGLSAEAISTADAGAPTRSIGLEADASGVVDAGSGVQNAVEVSAESAAVADAAAGIERAIEISALATGAAEAFAGVQRTAHVAGDAEGVGDAGGDISAESSAWSPDTAFGADLLVWFDASDAGSMTLDGSDRVTAMTNNGSLGGTATPQGSTPPQYLATGLNGLPVLVQDGGTNEGLVIDFGSSLPLGDSESAMAGVGRMTINDGVNPRSLFLWGSDVDGVSYRNIVGFAGVQYGHFSTTNLIGGQAWLNVAQISSYEHEPGTNYGTVNGTDLAPVTETETITTTADPFIIMIEDELEMQEILVVNRLLTSDEREKLHGYLAHKWGLESLLPGAHPYKSSPP